MPSPGHAQLSETGSPPTVELSSNLTMTQAKVEQLPHRLTSDVVELGKHGGVILNRRSGRLDTFDLIGDSTKVIKHDIRGLTTDRQGLHTSHGTSPT